MNENRNALWFPAWLVAVTFLGPVSPPPLSVQEPKVRATLRGHTDGVSSVAYSPDGKTLASGGADEIKLWDVATGKELATLKGHTDGVWSAACDPDGKTLVSGSADKTIKLWAIPVARQADK